MRERLDAQWEYMAVVAKLRKLSIHVCHNQCVDLAVTLRQHRHHRSHHDHRHHQHAAVCRDQHHTRARERVCRVPSIRIPRPSLYLVWSTLFIADVMHVRTR